MSIVIPTAVVPAKSQNPKFMVLFGTYKTGKSSLCANMKDTLVLDLEHGYDNLACVKISINNYRELYETRAELAKPDAPKFRRIVIDNASRLEEWAAKLALAKYRNTKDGKEFGAVLDPKTGKAMKKVVEVNGVKQSQIVYDPNADVLDIPWGKGYKLIKECITEMCLMFQPYCETVILVSHMKEKTEKKNGVEVQVKCVDLGGKAGDVLCGLADAIGYVSLQNGVGIVNFFAGDDVNRGARPDHLRNKAIEVSKLEQDGTITFNAQALFVD